MDFSKFTPEILLKKVNALLKFIDESKHILPIDCELVSQIESFSVSDVDLSDNDKLINLLTVMTKFQNEMKNIIKEETKKREEQEKLEEKRKQEEAKAFREEQERLIKETCIHDLNLFTRLKFRFFNLVVFDPENESDEINSFSPPFFTSRDEQFEQELKSRSFKLFKATYDSSEVLDREKYKIKNLNKTFASSISEDFSRYIFACFRVTNDAIFESYWISNYNGDINDLMKDYSFTFEEISDIDQFISCFNKTKDENVINEVYAR